ncbi:MAG TPA: MBL fold metallo-hydrolase [Pirellulales bacterium]|nr:MBL fold metallo-hydrolase [Pirellulales bacterium]
MPDPALRAAETIVEIGTRAAKSGVPSWDARGLGPLPWQGIACLDMSDDGRSIVVGTIAPQGDSNLLQLDADGRIVGEHIAGQRWVNETVVSSDGRFIAGLCGTPEGTSGDVPRLYGFLDGTEVSQLGGKGDPQSEFKFADFRPQWCLWHYGEHSNHLPNVFCRAGDRIVVAGDQSIDWLSPGNGAPGNSAPGNKAAERARIGPGLTISLAASPGGTAVVGRFNTGFYYTPREAAEHSDIHASDRSRPAFQNLLIVRPDNKTGIVWSRAASSDVVRSPQPAQGIYGPRVPPHEDLRFEAPLAVAIDRAGQRIAVADYEGWQRVFHPRDGSRDIPFGTRFMPSRPTIHIYDLHGNMLRRIGPESFADPFWCDLAFSLDGQTLVVSPHNWTSRGLGGQPLLPVDDKASTLYLCDTGSGDLRTIGFPDAIASADTDAAGTTALGCWNHKVYWLDKTGHPVAGLPDGVDVGAASLVRGSKTGASRFAVATTAGILSMFDGAGKKLWQTNLNETVRHAEKPWTKNQKADPIAPGIWRTNGGRAHSDLGSQIVIEAPRGLILIDPNAGESFEQNWARMVGAGLDPMRIKYVLITHEHGDHAPGARLWRVVTGAQSVAGATTAYDLQHLTPLGTGYGFHPPTPVDIPIAEDRELDLAGLKVKAICLPGHTYGSMGYVFRMNGRTYAATGDLIMGGGVLGYDGSLDFSAEDVLRSLRKVASFRPDMILGGHGIGRPTNSSPRASRRGKRPAGRT